MLESPAVNAMRLYAGQTVTSAIDLPELPLAEAQDCTAQFRIELHDTAWSPSFDDWTFHWRKNAGSPLLSLGYRGYTAVLHFPGAALVQAHTDGRIGVTRLGEVSDDTLRHILLDQVLPRLLAHRGDFVLHAAAAVLGDSHGIVIAGESGGGKSTLCAALAYDGAQLLTDDGLLLHAVDGRVMARAGYPSLRLLPDSLAAFYPHEELSAVRVADYSEKRRVVQHDFGANAVQVSAIFALQPPPIDPDSKAEIRIDVLPPQQACMELVRNTFQLDPTDMQRAMKTLEQAARIGAHLPLFTLSYPHEYQRLPEVVARIREAVQSESRHR